MELPNGTVTFLLTDIKSSTFLWEQRPRTMPDALVRHNELARIIHEYFRAQVLSLI